MAMGTEDNSPLATTFKSVFWCGAALPCRCHLKMKVLSLTLLVLVLVICSSSSADSPNRQFCLVLFFHVCVCFSLCVMNLTTVSQVVLKQLLKRVGRGDATWYIHVVLYRLNGKTQIINLLSNNFHWKSRAVFRMCFIWCTLVLQRLWVGMWQREKKPLEILSFY